ncbi:hypothetical protein GGF32_004449 [Allomyces javanicus]|nr:hypothetical protein GGF32_004449 [Allomyces javanicus]
MHCSTPTARALLIALLLALQLLVPAAVATPVAADEHALARRDPQFASDWFSRMFPWGNRNSGSDNGSGTPSPTSGSTTTKSVISAGERAQLVTMAKYASAAYCLNDLGLRAWTCGINCMGGTAGTKDVTVFRTPINGIKGYMGVNDNLRSLVIVFRGTVEPANIAADANGMPILASQYGAGAMVHAGFAGASAEAKSQVQAWVKSKVAQHPDYKISVTGHSLGGAVAILAGLDMHAAFPSAKVAVTTFGEPRVGNRVFANFVDAQKMEVVRVVHEDDMVPHTPPPTAGYRHHAGEVYEELGQAYKCVGQEDLTCSAKRALTQNGLAHMSALGVMFGGAC